MAEAKLRGPRVNHVAMSVPGEMLDAEHRQLLGDFYSDVFGWTGIEQFVYLHGDDQPMSCPRLDHYGFSVGTEEELDEVLARARAFQARDDRVDIIDKSTEDHGMLAITAIYVGYLLPMMVEIQWWDYK